MHLSVPAAAILHHLRPLNARQLLEAAPVPVGRCRHHHCLAQLPNDQHLHSQVVCIQNTSGCQGAQSAEHSLGMNMTLALGS